MTVIDHDFLDRDPAVLLVVDAYEPSRLGLGLMLQRESWVSRCVVAGSIERAAQLAQHYRPEVAVVDVSELGPFAGAAVATLRDARPGLQVVLTAHCSAASVPNARQLGATAFVPAGTPASVILKTVRGALHEETVTVEQVAPRPEGPALSQRERDVLALLVTGATNREIAAELFLGPDTVKKHASSLYRKLGVRNRTEATQQASRLMAAAH
jgi:DNA-binding NarL/FixJ family response regulator